MSKKIDIAYLQNNSFFSGGVLLRINEYISSHKCIILLFLGYIATVALTMFISWWEILQFAADLINKNHLVVVLPLIVICIALFVVLLRRWKSYPERVFLILAIPALLFFALFVPPHQVPDEIRHIHRVFDYMLPNGGTTIPESIVYSSETFPRNYAMLYEAIARHSGWGENIFIPDGLSNYALHLYIAAGVVVDLAEVLNLNPFIAICLARITNACIFVVIGYWIIKLVPLGKVVVCIYLLNPMLIQQEASCSADAMVNAIVLLYIAYLFKLVCTDRPFKFQFALLLLLTFFMCLSKYAYAPLLVLWLLFVNKIRSKKVRVAIYISSCTVIILAAALVIAFYDGETYQASFVLMRNVPEFINVMLNTAYSMTALWVKETFGMILGALNITIWEPCFWAYVLILLFSLVFNLGEKRGLSRSEKVISVIVTMLVTLPMIIVFREWTLEVDQRSDVIMGVQGRYFLPYLMLPLLCLVTPKSSLIRPNVLVLYSSVMVFIYLIDAATIVSTFI